MAKITRNIRLYDEKTLFGVFFRLWYSGIILELKSVGSGFCVCAGKTF